MNWTGGRLNLHAKSNNNPQLKAQKRHFANAQLRIHKQQQQNKTAIYRQGFQKRVEDFGDVGSTSQLRGSQNLRKIRSHYFGKRENSELKLRDDREEGDSISSGDPGTTRNPSLDQVKERFLNSADWLGLAGARPVQMQFRTVEEMSKVGRHRRKSSRERMALRVQHDVFGDRFASPVLGKRKQRDEARDKHVDQAALKQDPWSTSARPSPYLPSTPPSLARYRLTSEPTGSSTSMSLPNLPATDLDRASYRLDSHEPESPQVDRKLLSLENIRDLSSFDDVKERLVSARRQQDRPNQYLSAENILRPGLLTNQPRSRDSSHRNSLASTNIQHQSNSQKHDDLDLFFDIQDDDDILLQKHLTDHDMMATKGHCVTAESEGWDEQNNDGISGVAAMRQETAPDRSALRHPGLQERSQQSSSVNGKHTAQCVRSEQERHRPLRHTPFSLDLEYESNSTARSSTRRLQHNKYSLPATLDPQAVQLAAEAAQSPGAQLQAGLEEHRKAASIYSGRRDTVSPSQASQTQRYSHSIDDSLNSGHKASHGLSQAYDMGSQVNTSRTPFLNKLHTADGSSSPYFGQTRKPLHDRYNLTH